MKCFAGIDIGAATTKAVIINEKKEMIGHAVNNSGANFEDAADLAFGKACDDAGLDNHDCIVTSTGYGRHNISYASNVKTEISCHAMGSYHHFAYAHTLIDIGGQDSKTIRINDAGKRDNFKIL